jgi:catechol 2,3-dioxygenase-like lactoylglutathione lyase family enzyme
MDFFYHLGLTVRSIVASSTFYREVVGLVPSNHGAKEDTAPPRVLADGVEVFDVRSDNFDRLTNNIGSEFSYQYLDSPDGRLTLQLVEYRAGGGGATAPAHNRCGTPHLSFFVDDLDQKRRDIEARGGVKITSDIVRLRSNIRSFYVQDPDGIPVEFLEVK